jgi:hypothetical protein
VPLPDTKTPGRIRIRHEEKVVIDFVNLPGIFRHNPVSYMTRKERYDRTSELHEHQSYAFLHEEHGPLASACGHVRKFTFPDPGVDILV